MNKDYKELNLPEIRELIVRHCHLEQAKQFVRNQDIVFNPLVIQKENKRVFEALNYIRSYSRLSLDGLREIDIVLDKLKLHQILLEQELLDVASHYHAVRRIKNSLRKDEVIELKDYVDSLYFNQHTVDEILRCIHNSATIKEDASLRYKELSNQYTEHNQHLSQIQKQIFTKYEDSLQEKVLYSRDNRFCLLIKNRDKNSHKGMLHGDSASGVSSYFEPNELIHYNNKRIELLDQLEREKQRILKELSLLVATDREVLAYNMESLIALDVVFAKASFGFERNTCVAQLNFKQDLVVDDFIHPLLDGKTVVSNSFRIKSEQRKIIISGSNTGGKTIVLKSIGLAVLMAYLAIPIPAREAKIPFYDKILYAIDDLQSIEKSLSTFSANLSSLNTIIQQASEKSLVLIDELGNGTDPLEGQALALAIIQHLVHHNVSLVCTTHFSKIKDYALEKNDMMLSSVGFDPISLKPNYHYIENDYGHSNSFKIAKRYLDDLSIVDQAIELYNRDKGESARLIEELEKMKKELVDKEEELCQVLLTNKELNNQYKQKLNDIKLSKEKIIEDFRLKQQIILDEFKRNLAENKIQKDDFEAEDDIEIADNNIIEDYEVGEQVRFALTNQLATIEKINGKQVELLINQKKMKTTLDKIIKTEQIKEIKTKIRTEFRVKESPKEVNVIGKNAEEAIHEVSIYIDKLLQSKLKFGHIVHGVGQGILRNRIHQYLKQNPFIKEYKLSDLNNGGFGATDIVLK